MSAFTEEQLNSMDKNVLITLFLSQQGQLNALSSQIEALTEQIKIMNQRKFGKKSDYNAFPGQMHLSDFSSEVFNEAEAFASSYVEPEITEITIHSHKRSKSKGKRDTDLAGLPARIIEHRIPDEELHQMFPHGYKELPVEIYKRLNVIPQTFLVDEHHVHIYASRNNDGTIARAKRPADVFRNSIATPDLLALIMSAKFEKAIPIERQASTFKNDGVNLPTNTLCNWVIRGAEDYLSLIYDSLHKELFPAKVIHADETPCTVVNDGRPSGSKSYMWVYRSHPIKGTKPIIIYDYQKTRAADHPRQFLKSYSGIVVTDGYQVYHTVEKSRRDLTIAGCWVHAKRGFSEIIKSIGEDAAKGSIALEARNRISEIFHLDNQLDELPASERKKQRQQVIKPKVDDFFAWAKQQMLSMSATGATAKSLQYCINQEQYLRVFLTDGNVPMDNNLAEQAIRPFTLGRKNWVTIDSLKGATASAIIYSIVETAKANDLVPFEYLRLLFREMPNHLDDKSTDFLQDLLPWSPMAQKICHKPKS